jgi:Transposase DDE domain group 1
MPMRNPTGESENQPLRLPFDPRLKLDFHGSRVTSDAGLLAYRELDDALGLTDLVGDELVDPRTGKSGQHPQTGLFRQPFFGRGP